MDVTVKDFVVQPKLGVAVPEGVTLVLAAAQVVRRKGMVTEIGKQLLSDGRVVVKTKGQVFFKCGETLGVLQSSPPASLMSKGSPLAAALVPKGSPPAEEGRERWWVSQQHILAGAGR